VPPQNYSPSAVIVSRAGISTSSARRKRQTWGGTDILIVNAGIEGPLKQIPDVELADFEQVIRVNLVGAFLLSKYGVPSIRKRGGGAIVMTASILAHVASKEWGPYSASKGGLVALMRSLAVDHGPEGIRVNAIAPAGIKTELMHRGLIAQGMDEQAAREYEATLATPRQIGEVAVYLASSQASMINGSSIMLDRGTTISF
jgi:NAD(P)-dependent dehydrogenase (short-subunit alcohol dehydrogenase family)